jgi:hypothetical protein
MSRDWILLASLGATGCLGATEDLLAQPPTCASATALSVSVDGAPLRTFPATGVSLSSPAELWLLLGNQLTPDPALANPAEQEVILSMPKLVLAMNPLTEVELEYRSYPASAAPRPPSTDTHLRDSMLAGWVRVDAIAARPGERTAGCFDLTTSGSPVIHAAGLFDGILLGPAPGE